MATLGLSKVFILDKYFTELQKFWETEKKLQGACIYKVSHSLEVYLTLCIIVRPGSWLAAFFRRYISSPTQGHIFNDIHEHTEYYPITKNKYI